MGWHKLKTRANKKGNPSLIVTMNKRVLNQYYQRMGDLQWAWRLQRRRAEVRSKIARGSIHWFKRKRFIYRQFVTRLRYRYIGRASDLRYRYWLKRVLRVQGTAIQRLALARLIRSQYGTRGYHLLGTGGALFQSRWVRSFWASRQVKPHIKEVGSKIEPIVSVLRRRRSLALILKTLSQVAGKSTSAIPSIYALLKLLQYRQLKRTGKRVKIRSKVTKKGWRHGRKWRRCWGRKRGPQRKLELDKKWKPSRRAILYPWYQSQPLVINNRVLMLAVGASQGGSSCGSSSVGRTSACHAGGRRFNPYLSRINYG